MKPKAIRLHNEQLELLNSLCSQLHISHSFFIRNLIDTYSTESFERLQSIRNKNETNRITSLSNKTPLQSLQKHPSNLGKSYKTNNKATNK
jgi:hypothetical protein